MDCGIAVFGSRTIFHSVALDGITLEDNGNAANGNDVSNSDDVAVFIQGNNNTISNDCTGATVGILKIPGSTGTGESGDLCFATLAIVVDPAPSRDFTAMPSR